MSTIDKISLKNTQGTRVEYDIKDSTARRLATTTQTGQVKPDGDTITVDADGTIHAMVSELDDLTDVSITSPTADQVLKYNATTQKWENGTGGGGPTSGVLLADGSVPADNLTIGTRAEGSTVGTSSLAIGTDVTASANNSVAEGRGTVASGYYSHAEGVYTEANNSGNHAEGVRTTTVNSSNAMGVHVEGYSLVKSTDTVGISSAGNGSHAEGCVNNETAFIHATGNGSHAEGYSATGYVGIEASGSGSHAEGYGGIKASSDGAHAEGRSIGPGSYDSTTETRTGMMASGIGAHAEGYVASASAFIHASGSGSHAEGYAGTGFKGVLASGQGAHAEGASTTASGPSSHAEGTGTKAAAGHSHAEGYNTTVDTNAQGGHVEGYSAPESSSTVGIYASAYGAHAEGCCGNATAFIRATGQGAHAEGYADTANLGILASGQGSHAEGGRTKAGGIYSHAEGYGTTTSGSYAHAEGYSTTAGGDISHAEGYGTAAIDAYSHAEGYGTSARLLNHAQGHYNKLMTSGANNSTTGDAMAIGNGTSDSAKSNCFRVTYAGAVYGLSAFNSSGADYAEFFEWKDGNVENEDRVGIFVTLDGDKIKPANSGDYILGIISGQPSVVGNGDEDWLGRWQRDDFGRFVWGDVENKDPVTGKMKKGRTILPNPDYDNTQKYIERKDRKEWDCVGMLGTLAVRDNGECEVNGFCDCGANGIAVPAETGYRVIARVSENVVKIIVK